MKRIEICVPRQSWNKFMRTICSHDFIGDPELIRHRLMSDGQKEYAAFISDYGADIAYVKAILPQGAYII